MLENISEARLLQPSQRVSIHVTFWRWPITTMRSLCIVAKQLDGSRCYLVRR